MSKKSSNFACFTINEGKTGQNQMRIAIISTRGIPNDYGGFEQFAEYISVRLVRRGHEVVVYSPHYHPYKDSIYKGVHIKHIYSPEEWMGGSMGSFFYDFACMKDALKNEHFDIIYEAGYTSIIPAYIWYNIRKRRDVVVATNMDGLEHKRQKFNPLVRRFLLWEERMAVKHSHYLIADNLGIKDYYQATYGKPSKYLAYGANIHTDQDAHLLEEHNLTPGGYYLVIARMEPENNIEMTIEGYLASREKGIRPLILVGKTDTPFAQKLIQKYKYTKSVRFVGGIYSSTKLNSLRKYSYAYFHSFTVGGTNPSLLEAMANGALVLAHDNIFNHAVLNGHALYYKSAKEITNLLNQIDTIVQEKKETFVNGNLNVIRERYTWEHITEQYEEYFHWILVDKWEHATCEKK